jgi:hypothetical protein
MARVSSSSSAGPTAAARCAFPGPGFAAEAAALVALPPILNVYEASEVSLR